MGSLWQFFGLPDPEASPPPPTEPAAEVAPSALSPIETDVSEPHQMTFDVEKDATTKSSAAFQPPPIGWEGPITPDGEAFHDLGIHHVRPPQRASIALRYVVPDEMKRIHTGPLLQRVLEGDTVIVDLRPLVHMESHQMACRRELKHACDNARINAFALDAEDKLLMLPGVATVVDTHKHRLGLQPLM